MYIYRNVDELVSIAFEQGLQLPNRMTRQQMIDFFKEKSMYAEEFGARYFYAELVNFLENPYAN